MAKFKVGDRVRRIRESHHLGMRVREVGTVSEVLDNGGPEGKFRLSGFAGTHAAGNLELVEAAPPGYTALKATPATLRENGEADPNGIPANAPGAKLDAGKQRPTLILRDMARALQAVIKIASDGAVKYTAGGWLVVPNGEERYEDAHLRHMLKRFAGQPVDTDSGSKHLAHEAWNALAKLELALREEERNGAAQA